MFWNMPESERFDPAPEIYSGDILVTNDEKVFEGFFCEKMIKKDKKYSFEESEKLLCVGVSINDSWWSGIYGKRGLKRIRFADRNQWTVSNVDHADHGSFIVIEAYPHIKHRSKTTILTNWDLIDGNFNSGVVIFHEARGLILVTNCLEDKMMFKEFFKELYRDGKKINI